MSVETIQHITARAFESNRDEMLRQDRARPAVKARHAAMWLARKYTGRSFSELGHDFRRDHTTVMHGCGMIEKWRRDDPQFGTRFDAAERAVLKAVQSGRAGE